MSHAVLIPCKNILPLAHCMAAYNADDFILRVPTLIQCQTIHYCITGKSGHDSTVLYTSVHPICAAAAAYAKIDQEQSVSYRSDV